MISAEQLPSPRYLALFHEALQRQKARFAHHLVCLAARMAVVHPETITLVSLARAGTPVGVLLTRILRTCFQRTVCHYSISIIRDRGVDEVALEHILRLHPASSVVFVDGWTGKGVIASELDKSVRAFNEREGERLDPGLHAVADLCGVATEAATSEDYLIPSSILGFTISGLVSRSILNDSVIGPGEFHGCLYYEDALAHDLSRWFVETVLEEVTRVPNLTDLPVITPGERAELLKRNRRFLQSMRERYDVRDLNHIKPGIGESTRVLLRRVPNRLLLRQADHEDVAHLRVLAEEKKVPMEIDPSLPFLAAALIKEMGE
jgi:hypothetical protein